MSPPIYSQYKTNLGRLAKKIRLTPLVFLIMNPSPTPSFFPKFATTPSQTLENSSSLSDHSSPSFLPMPGAKLVLTFPVPKMPPLICCTSSSDEHNTSTTRTFSGRSNNLAPPCDQTSCGTCNLGVI